MKLYRCHKYVHAARITAVQAFATKGGCLLTLDDGAQREMTAAWNVRHAPAAGGYLVRYEDGYESFSPSDAFEKGYLLVSPKDELGVAEAAPAPKATSMRRVRIIGNGLAGGTKVLDAETGEMLTAVQKISFSLDADNQKLCRIEQLAIVKSIDLDTSAEVVIREFPASSTVVIADSYACTEVPAQLLPGESVARLERIVSVSHAGAVACLRLDNSAPGMGLFEVTSGWAREQGVLAGGWLVVYKDGSLDYIAPPAHPVADLADEPALAPHPQLAPSSLGGDL